MIGRKTVTLALAAFLGSGINLLSQNAYADISAVITEINNQPFAGATCTTTNGCGCLGNPTKCVGNGQANMQCTNGDGTEYVCCDGDDGSCACADTKANCLKKLTEPIPKLGQVNRTDQTGLSYSTE